MRKGISLVAIWLISAMLIAAAPVLNESVPAESLRFGNRGEDVLQLQQQLIDLGYLHDRADGIYGARTKSAVMRMQRQCGLTQDGVLGEATLEALTDPESAQAVVHIAPSGKRYHSRSNCRGLNAAKSVAPVGFLEAKLTRTPCILCYGRFALHLALEVSATEIEKETSVVIDSPNDIEGAEISQTD